MTNKAFYISYAIALILGTSKVNAANIHQKAEMAVPFFQIVCLTVITVNNSLQILNRNNSNDSSR